MITADQLERIFRTITQSGAGLIAGEILQKAGHVGMASLTGLIVTLGITIGAAVLMNIGPRWLRPLAGDVEKILAQQHDPLKDEMP
jgi:hypothetical protein